MTLDDTPADLPGDVAPPDAFELLADYERRSLAHVAGLPEQLQAAGLWRGIGFRIGQRRLVSQYESVAEILTVPQITPVPGAYGWMLGVANVRSNLLPVVDLKQFLEGARSVLYEGHQKVMVLRQPGGDVAVTIDELYGQRSFMDEQEVDAGALADGRYAGFIDRAYRLDDDVWGVFSLDRLVRTPEFRHAAV
jgi:twitching motility protein PilI